MKTIARQTGIYTFALFVLPHIVSGFKIHGGFLTFLIGGFVLALMFLLVKPILKILTLPLTMVTFGLFSFLVNAIILFLMTIAVPQITLQPFVSESLNLLGFIIPPLSFNLIFAYIATSLVLSAIVSCIEWLYL